MRNSNNSWKDNPNWIEYRSPLNDMPILSLAAIAKRTNYVRILVANGADVRQATKPSEKLATDQAKNLILQMESGK